MERRKTWTQWDLGHLELGRVIGSVDKIGNSEDDLTQLRFRDIHLEEKCPCHLKKFLFFLSAMVYPHM